MTTLTALWRDAEQQTPHKVAVIDGDRRYTYRQLGAKIRGLAANLAARWGVGRGDVVSLLAPNGAEFVISYFAIVHLGAIVQPLDERLRPDEIRALLLDSGARVLIVHHALWPAYTTIQDQLPGVEHVLAIGISTHQAACFSEWAVSGPTPDETPITPDTIAELMYTSGTTGEPKAVMRSHANVRAAARNAILGFGYTTDDVIAIIMPLSHSSALNSQMMPLLELGGTLVLLRRFDVESLLDVIRAEGVTCMRAAPTMLRLLLTAPRFCADELPSLRRLINSSGVIDAETYVALKRRFAPIQVMNSYGLTEASTCTVLPDEMALTRPDSIGRPIEGVEMCIIDEDDGLILDEREGEICIRGAHVFVGYRHRPLATNAVLVNGWLRTGDLGHRDADGFYYLHGRKDDVINCAGHKVTPVEIESCIMQLPAVAEVVVVGQAHRILGEVVKAVVVPRAHGDLDKKQITQHCARHLASHKIPFFVEFVSALPKTSTGKPLRRKLKETAP